MDAYDELLEELKDIDLPPGPDGTGYTLMATNDGFLVADPEDRTPISAAAECTALILACVEPNVRNLRGCFEAAPVCSSDTPWTGDDTMCCHKSCADRYVELREDGLDEAAAAITAIHGPEACSPGVDELLAEEAAQ